MGHVDHGKTTLLDHLRNSQIVEQEFGGITQHIGAFVVPFKQGNRTELVTFLDTPGHAAFAAMRQRGADITDIVVLVIACEDGILDQTVESIKYAKTSQVPIIVAVNKIDKFSKKSELDRNIQLLRDQLKVYDLITELDGGDIQMVPISALQGTGIEDLKENILALAETLDLKAEVDCGVTGRVIESLVSPHRGKLCTVLVQRGVLHKGDYLLAGTYNWARVRALFDERGQMLQSCGPGLPVQVTGWREDELPNAGDSVLQVESESEAKRIIADHRQKRALERANEDSEEAAKRAEEFQKKYKEKLSQKRESGRYYGRIFFNERGVRPKESEDNSHENKINLILKCDVDGSLDAMLALLDSYDKSGRQPVKLDIMHFGVGNISENDLTLASSFPNTVIYGFNVKPASPKILTQAKHSGTVIKMFNVIYHLIDDLKARLSEKLPDLEAEHEIGRANVIQEFVITETRKRKSHVAGCRCSRGTLKRDAFYRLVRNNEIIANDLQVKTLKHLKDDVKEIERDRECGISFEGDQEITFIPGDLLIAYERRKYKPKLKWDLKGFN